MPKGQRGEGVAPPARDHGQAEADRERGEDTDLQGSGRGVRLLGLYVRADVLSGDGQGPVGLPTGKEEHQAHGRKSPRADRPSGYLAGDHKAGGSVEPRPQELRRRARQESDGRVAARLIAIANSRWKGWTGRLL